MTKETVFPSLEGWESTKETLHLYALAVGVVPRVHAAFHPKWWHVSLKVSPNGLVTDEMPLPDGGSFTLRMDLRHHEVVLATSGGDQQKFNMRQGISSSQFGDRIVAAVTKLGLDGEYAREKYANDEPRSYDPEMAERFFSAVTDADRIFKHHRNTLPGKVGPVQLWPHGFDLAFEWFGTRMETHEEAGELTEILAQLNLGFSPGDSSVKPYFYSNPWPFEADALLARPLPSGASWYTDSWKGTMLPYAELVGDPRAENRLLTFARSVFEICSPTLMAD